MSTDKLTIKRMDEITPVHRQFGRYDEFESFPVVARSENRRCCVGFYRIPPGKANFPYHYHELNEEVFYIVSGSGIILTEDGTKELASGDVVFCPPAPGGAHKIANVSESEPLVYLEFDTANYPDVVQYPKTGAFGILRRDPAGNEFRRQEPEIDYSTEVEMPEQDW